MSSFCNLVEFDFDFIFSGRSLQILSATIVMPDVNLIVNNCLWLVCHLRVDRGSLFILVPEPAKDPIANKLLPRDAGLTRDDHGDGRDRTHEGHEQAEGEKLAVR